jgi:hypothetical protein
MDTKILDFFKMAIIKAYKESDDYFKPTEGRERSMVFRVAHHLASDIEKELEVFVDIEATRCNGRSKRDDNNAIVVPDLVIHQRRGKGYFVAEFKCNRKRAEKDHDYAKLSIFTLKNKPKYLKACCPSYEMGAFVYLGNHIDDIRITLFENGEVIRGMKDVSLHEI